MAIHDQVRTDRGTVRDVSEGRDESLTDISATKLLGDNLPSSPSDGEVLRFNGSSGAWEHAGHGVFGTEVVILTPDQNTPISLDPANIDADAPDWNFTVQSFSNTSLSRDNAVARWGWNEAPGGGRAEGGTDRISLGWSLETFFENPNDNIPQVEAHLEFFDENNTSYRLISFSADRDVAGSTSSLPIIGGLIADRVEFQDSTGTQYLLANNSTGVLNLPTGLTLDNGVNDAWILRGRDSGSNTQNILKIDSSDVLVFAEGGNVVTLGLTGLSQINLKNSVTIVPETTGGFIRFGEVGGTAAEVHLIASDGNVLEMNRDATSQWQWTVGTTGLVLRSKETNNRFLFFESGDLEVEDGDLILAGHTTATSASAGANGDVPAQVAGYLTININGTTRKVPFYAN